MSNLSGLIVEQAEIKNRLDQSVLTGDLDTNTKLTRSLAEVERRLYFARTADFRERLAALESERAAANDLRKDFQTELKAQAEKVLEARSRAFDEQEIHNGINARLHFLDIQIETGRQTINDLKAELKTHLAKKLYGESNNEKETT